MNQHTFSQKNSSRHTRRDRLPQGSADNRSRSGNRSLLNTSTSSIGSTSSTSGRTRKKFVSSRYRNDSSKSRSRSNSRSKNLNTSQASNTSIHQSTYQTPSTPVSQKPDLNTSQSSLKSGRSLIGTPGAVTSSQSRSAIRKPSARERFDLLENQLLQLCLMNAKADQALQQQEDAANAQLCSAWKVVRKRQQELAQRKSQVAHNQRSHLVHHGKECMTPAKQQFLNESEKFQNRYDKITQDLKATTHRLPTNGPCDETTLHDTLSHVSQILGSISNTLDPLSQDAAESSEMISDLQQTVNNGTEILSNTENELEQLCTDELTDRSKQIYNLQLSRANNK
eukprot:gb/GECH01002175.1/.p1 GENE.gb/GECH01002175.1/~~gb/GECH01002175.1/.p1  ORF type:complete len:339 (+),score=92.40 gb/GECH01002175.1/:1-1017(+)